MEQPENVQMTQQELHQFQESFKKKEFRTLFFDYMNEISSPESRDLYEQEISALEKERGFDVAYIKPVAGFSFSLDEVFINICSSDVVDAPVSTAGKNGTNWTIPYSLSKPRQEVPDLETIYDCVFHNITLEKCSIPAFKKLVIETAIEGLSKQFGLVFNSRKVF